MICTTRHCKETKERHNANENTRGYHLVFVTLRGPLGSGNDDGWHSRYRYSDCLLSVCRDAKKAWRPYWICTMMTLQANQFGYI